MPEQAQLYDTPLKSYAVTASELEPLAARRWPEQGHPYRGAFERDRARVLHARAFRRLAGKTQVFTERYSDHFRSRLTHTLEVAQISRTLAHSMGLNAELAETLALVHDIGHPPFGHAGEQALDRALRKHGRHFDHNLHALRIVEFFEQRYASFHGLNLTLGVREGIIKHSRDYSPKEYPELAEYLLDLMPPLEAQLIDLADEIAYLTADMDDGLESGMLSLDQIRAESEIFAACWLESTQRFPLADARLLFHESLKRMLDIFVTGLMQQTQTNVEEGRVQTLDDIRKAPGRMAALPAHLEQLRAQSKRFLYRALYQSDELEETHRRAELIVTTVFEALIADPSMLPPGHESRIEAEGIARTVSDYIAGMTDPFIVSQFRSLTGEGF